MLDITDWSKEVGLEDPVNDILLAETIEVTEDVELEYEHDQPASFEDLFAGQQIEVQHGDGGEEVTGLLLLEKADVPADGEVIRAWGPLLTTYSEPWKMTEHEVTVTEEEDVQFLLRAMERAEIGEGAVMDAGPNFVMSVKEENGQEIEYAFFIHNDTAAFEKRDGGSARFYLETGDLEKILEILYRSLEEEVDVAVGVYAFMAPIEYETGVTAVSVTMENSRPVDFVPEEVRLRKLNDEGEWETFPEEGSDLPVDPFVCRAREKCQVEVDLSGITDGLPAGEYDLRIGSLSAAFFVREQR